jgi:hypothetical protein
MPHQRSRLRLVVPAAVATTAASAVALTAILLAPPSTSTVLNRVSLQSPLSVAGRGATVPFTEYEAEDAATNGTVLTVSRTATTLAAEASGRSAVTLTGSGKYVEFTLTKAANAVNLHYSIPDSAGGGGQTAPLAVYVNGAKDRDITLTSKYAWLYGGYPFTNTPTNNQHYFYDDIRFMFGSTLQIGTRVRFQVDSGSTATTLDTADFEPVPAAIAQPAGSLSVLDYGADGTGAADSGSAFDAAVAAASAQGKVLYVPQGTYTVNRHIIVNNVTMRGAGPWYTVLRGDGIGVYGNYAPNPSANVKLYDFAIFGEISDRNDGAQVNGIGGSLGGGSVVSNIWIQHTKVGLWLDGPFDGLTVTGNRILDQTADGLNLHNGISHVTVTQNFIRNTGDDGLAMWSEINADHDNTFSFNTVLVPTLANNIAIYGGHDNAMTDNVVAETQNQGGGLHVAQRFNSTPLSGVTTVARNTTLRAGVLDSNWQFGVGAVWFDARDAAMSGTVNVTDTDILDSNYEAIQFISGSSITNVHFTNVRIDGAGTFALQLQVGGSASFTNVTAAHIGGPSGIYSCLGGGFTITQGTGNSGWYTATPYCGPWPAPVYTGGPTSSPPSSPSPTPTSPSPSPSPSNCTPGTGNLALHKTATASSANQTFVAANAVDGDANTYWESTNNAFPQSLTVDLCAATTVARVVLKLPPSTAWGARTQTLSVLGSTNGSSWSTLASPAGYPFDPNTGNTATISFAAATARYVQVSFSANTGWPAGQAGEFEVYGTGGSTSPPPSNTNLALGKATSASGNADVYVPGRTVDGDANSYWESTNSAFPQWIQVDLGAATSVGRAVLKLPPATAWATRTQTLTVQASTDGSSWTTVVGSAGYTFNPGTGNTVTISFAATSTRYLRLTFTANTGWPAGQLSEYEIYAS